MKRGTEKDKNLALPLLYFCSCMRGFCFVSSSDVSEILRELHAQVPEKIVKYITII